MFNSSRMRLAHHGVARQAASRPRARIFLLVVLAALLGFSPLSAQTKGLLPGQEIALSQCLRFSVMSMRDRDGAMDLHDWVTVRIKSECTEMRRYLLVELILFDPVGNPYGGKLWLLGRGERLLPGYAKTENYAVPDPGNLMPSRWLARLLYVEKPGSRRRALPPGTKQQIKSGPTIQRLR